jgi:hypothetical protein
MHLGAFADIDYEDAKGDPEKVVKFLNAIATKNQTPQIIVYSRYLENFILKKETLVEYQCYAL